MRFLKFFLLFVPVALVAQTNFSAEEYEQFLETNKNLTAQQILNRYEPDLPFYNNRTDNLNVMDYAFLDSVKIHYKLTEDELEMLQNNHFFVSERLSYDCFGRAMHDIYEKDLPVMVTSDAILSLSGMLALILFSCSR